MKNYACDYTRHCGSFAKDDCQGCPKATNTATALMAEAEKATREKHNYVMALAMNHDPATVIVGGTEIPVVITDVESNTCYGSEPDTKFTCQIVNLPKTPVQRAVDNLTNHLRRMYGDARVTSGSGKAAVNRMFAIDRVYFNDPVTVVLWKDGTKTIVRCQEGDTYSAETGLALCFAKKALGNKGNFNDVFKKFVPEKKVETEETPVEVVEAV